MDQDRRDDLRREVRGAARSAAGELGRTVIGAFIDWVKSRPLKRARQRRREERAARAAASPSASEPQKTPQRPQD